MLWENEKKYHSEILLESIRYPILHIRLEIKPVKTLIYDQHKTQPDKWL